MKTLQNVKDIAEEIHRLHPNPKGIVVSIDGADGIGKTEIAENLATAIDFVHLKVDRFRNYNQASYLKDIRYSELKESVAIQLVKAHGIIIEGICIKEVIDRLSLKPNISIYVKKMVKEGNHTYWSHNYLLFDEYTPVEYLRHSQNSGIIFGQESGEHVQEYDPLADSIVKDLCNYHFRRRPYEYSDIIFENVWRNA